MAIFQLQSTNPRFSYVIGKNPHTGMIVKSVRKGKAFGWFSDDHTYNVYFKDADNEVSYPKGKEESFEYLNVSRYNTPLFPLNVVADFFGTASKKQQQDDLSSSTTLATNLNTVVNTDADLDADTNTDLSTPSDSGPNSEITPTTAPYEHTLTVNLVGVENKRYLAFFHHHFPDYELGWEELAHENYRITIKTQKSIYELLNYSNSLFLFLSLMSRTLFDITDDTIEKYIRNLNVIDAPFFIRYLFARNVLTKRDRFRRYKGLLEDTTRYEIEFAFGNTATQRKEWITDHLGFGLPIVDLGCGEGAYTIPYSKKIAPLFVHAIDIDEVARTKVAQKAEKLELNNIILYESLDHFLETEPEETYYVILTEVVEHMPIEAAEELLHNVTSRLNINKLIITTPNRDFNQFYQIDLRHDDHQWEMNEAEFRSWLEKVTPAGWDIFHQGIGDKVNGIQTTQGAVLTRKNSTDMVSTAQTPKDSINLSRKEATR
jgi:small RNA 2'-O-methyltransferase